MIQIYPPSGEPVTPMSCSLDGTFSSLNNELEGKNWVQDSRGVRGTLAIKKVQNKVLETSVMQYIMAPNIEVNRIYKSTF